MEIDFVNLLCQWAKHSGKELMNCGEKRDVAGIVDALVVLANAFTDFVERDAAEPQRYSSDHQIVFPIKQWMTSGNNFAGPAGNNGLNPDEDYQGHGNLECDGDDGASETNTKYPSPDRSLDLALTENEYRSLSTDLHDHRQPQENDPEPVASSPRFQFSFDMLLPRSVPRKLTSTTLERHHTASDKDDASGNDSEFICGLDLDSLTDLADCKSYDDDDFVFGD